MHTGISLPAVFLILFILAAFSIFFSLAETSIIGLSRIRLRHLLARGVRRAESVHRLVMKLEKVIAAILIGNNLVNIAISAIVTGIFVEALGYRWGVVISTFVTTFCILVFCEITPKIFAARHAEKVALLSAPLMEVMTRAFRPLTGFFIGISNAILTLLRAGGIKKPPLITAEELRIMIEIGGEEGVLSEEERKMLQRIFEFADTRAGEVMVPKDKIIAVDVNTSPEELLNIFVEEGHARLPVYQDSPENIIGVIHARDLLYILRDKGLFVLQDLIRQVYYAPKDMKVNELLKRFQLDKIQIAVVVDEHKKALGLVTLEDLTEEIVGEVEESHPGHYRKAQNKAASK